MRDSRDLYEDLDDETTVDKRNFKRPLVEQRAVCLQQMIAEVTQRANVASAYELSRASKVNSILTLYWSDEDLAQ